MPSYYRSTVREFLEDSEDAVLGSLSNQHANDGYYQLLGTQSKSWAASLPLLKNALTVLVTQLPQAADWGVLLEYPLYRLRKRIDMVLVAPTQVYVIELKIGKDTIDAADRQQVEEYALDLRDFHKASHSALLIPILCCTEYSGVYYREESEDQVQPVHSVSTEQLPRAVAEAYRPDLPNCLDWQAWEASPYEPVPTIIEAATTIFAGHGVREISRADADNLKSCSQEALRLLAETEREQKKRILIVTGVPGSGKTLAGLNIVHESKSNDANRGRVVYLSGNTPLVLVIREALAQDEKRRADRSERSVLLKDIRAKLRARIQHINDYLKHYYAKETELPHENAIVFDEAQRAWDRKHGKDKFNRDASEPELLMRIMSRRSDWAVIVCLVGAGQEINAGEPGMCQWGQALAKDSSWEVVTPRNALLGEEGTAGTALFPDGIPPSTRVHVNDKLRLSVPLRSYRSELVSKWVDAVLEDRPEEAHDISKDLRRYPISLTRSIEACREVLSRETRGTRRCGLLASAGAARLVAEGLGASLNVQDKHKIAHWYLKPRGDYRSSNSLEVTANEYTCQGLEIDYAGICWGGDMTRVDGEPGWCFRRLRKTSWQNVRNPDMRRYILNKYRVFLTRAREGMVLFIPRGDPADSTRVPGTYDAIASYLSRCGALPL